MISRLVTVDLLVTAATRINSQRPQGDPIKLFSSVVEILNCWAHKIESQGVSVSVECILDNVFWLKEQQQCVEWDDFKNLGLDLIETAAEFDSRLTSDRCLQSVSRPQMERMERALESNDKVPFREAAKIVTGVKNPTEASESCRKCLNWCISESYIRDSLSPKVIAVIEKVLSEIQSDKRPEIPRELAVELRREYLVFKAVQPKGSKTRRR